MRAPLPDPPVLSQAKRLLDKGEAESAATVLRRFLLTSPRPEHLDDTYLLLGAALYGMKEYAEALKCLTQLQTEFPASELAERGKIMLARTHAAMGNIDLALPLLAQLRTSATDEDTQHEALRLTAEFLVQKKEYVRAIEALLQESAAGTEEHMAETRAQIREFINEKLDKKALTRMPSSLQAADYSAARQYLTAVKAVGTDDADKVLAQMKKTKINDVFAKGGYIRGDGRMVHDMYLMQVKSPDKSTEPWDYYNVVETMKGEAAWTTKAESKCALWK